MNMLVIAPIALPTQEVTRPTDPSACRTMPFTSDAPGIRPCAVRKVVTRFAWNPSVARSWLTCAVT